MDDRRNLALPGCANLRDLGGLPTRSGARVAPGRLFRGAELPSDAEAVAGLVAATGVRRVLDLRMDEEVDRSGPPLLPSGCVRVRVPLFEAAQRHWTHPIVRTPPSTARRYFEMLEVGSPAVVRIVDLLGEADTAPTLIHCAAGRDRTGIVTACILDLLDVPEEAIRADYALSSVMDDEEGRKADPRNVTLLLRHVRDRFGSVREMLRAAGASEQGMERLRGALLGPARAGEPPPNAPGGEGASGQPDRALGPAATRRVP